MSRSNFCVVIWYLSNTIILEVLILIQLQLKIMISQSGYAYNDFQQISSADFHIYVGADNHFPQNIKYHTMMFFKCAALWKRTISQTMNYKKLTLKVTLIYEPKETDSINNLTMLCWLTFLHATFD